MKRETNPLELDWQNHGHFDFNMFPYSDTLPYSRSSLIPLVLKKCRLRKNMHTHTKTPAVAKATYISLQVSSEWEQETEGDVISKFISALQQNSNREGEWKQT